MLNFYNLNSPLSPIQIHLYIIVFCLIHSFPFSPGLLLFVLSFQTFPVVSQLPRAKSVPQLIILIVPTNRRYKSMQSLTDDFTILSYLLPFIHILEVISPFCRKSLLSSNSDFAQTMLYFIFFLLFGSLFRIHFCRGRLMMEVQLLRRRSNTGSEEPLAYLKIT